MHAPRARQQTVSQCNDGHDANCNSRGHWQCERLRLSTFGPLTHVFPQVTMPGRSTQQNLRNFVLRPEPLAVVNAELLFGNIKIGRERTRSVLSLTAALGHSRRSDRAPFTSGLPRLADILWVGRHVSNVPTTDQAVPVSRMARVADLTCPPVPRLMGSCAIHHIARLAPAVRGGLKRKSGSLGAQQAAWLAVPFFQRV